jgi:hypothetical protein
MNRVTEIREKVDSLVNEAIELLEANYDMDAVDTDNPAYMTMMDLNGALIELENLDDNGLMIRD